MDEAFAQLETFARQGFLDWSKLVEDERMQDLVRDPRFEALREKMEKN